MLYTFGSIYIVNIKIYMARYFNPIAEDRHKY